MRTFFFSFFLFLLFTNCKKTQTVISAEPSAKARTTPHQTGGEQFSLDKGTAIKILGISSTTDKLTIGGKEYNEHWYLVEDLVNVEHSGQGWIYGGCIDFAADADKKLPSLNLNLAQKEIEFVPCFEGFDEKKNPSCGTDCGVGTFTFLNGSEFLSTHYCMGSGVDYCLGNYEVNKNKLILRFGKQMYNILEEEEGVEKQAPSLTEDDRDVKQTFEIHFLGNQPVFTSIEGNEYFGGVPKKSKALSTEVQEIIEKLRKK